MPKHAVILLSGGLDSATVLSVAKAEGYACHALSFDYGQRHAMELECARKLATAMGAVRHEIVSFDLRKFGGSALTADIEVPKEGQGTVKGQRSEVKSQENAPIDIRQSTIDNPQRSRVRGQESKVKGQRAVDGEQSRVSEAALSPIQNPKSKIQNPSHPQSAIPITYVPARNTIFLSFALAFAEVIESSDIFIGVNAVDYSGYPDCRPEYIAAFERMANLATRAGVEGQKLRIHTPLIHLSKAEIIRLGLKNGVDYALTTSCYDPGPGGEPCGRCDSCRIRIKGFEEVGMRDPRLP